MKKVDENSKYWQRHSSNHLNNFRNFHEIFRKDVIFKSHKRPGFNTSLEDIFFEKPQKGSQIETPSCFEIKGEVIRAHMAICSTKNTKMPFHYYKIFRKCFALYRFSLNRLGTLYQKSSVCLPPLHIFSKVYLKVLVKQHLLI